MKNVFDGNIGNKITDHPTEKYEWMIKPLILRHSKEGDLIADFFYGSGTIPAIAKKFKRKYFGCELRKDYFEMGKKRIEATKVSKELRSKYQPKISNNIAAGIQLLTQVSLVKLD